MSETFLKAFDKFDSYDDTYAFSTWIYTIARNVLNDHFRKNKIQEYDIDDLNQEDSVLIDTKIENFEKQLNVEMSIEGVKKILDQIPAFQRECIILRYLQDLDYEQIAEITDRSQANVRQGISRWLKYLRENSSKLLVLIMIINIAMITYKNNNLH